LSPLQTALSNTTISGYVSASANFSLTPNEVGRSPGNFPGLDTFNIPMQGQSKQDGFNLDVVKISIAKPQDESPWASGYQVDLLLGPDAGFWNGGNTSGFGDQACIQQAYVVVRTPIGNGIDWKFGVFNTVIGYESFDAGSNPNYTRSWAWGIEPTEHTGILATYKINDLLSISAGVANTSAPGINNRAYNYNGSLGHYASNNYNKTGLGSVTFTSPSSWGWAAGSTLTAGAVYGWNASNSGANGNFASGDQVNYYAGLTLNTPLKQLTLGAAFDYAQNLGGGANQNQYNYYSYSYTGSVTAHQDVWVAGVYGTFKATDKLSFSLRGEYQQNKTILEFNNVASSSFNTDYTTSGFEVTGTVEYDLWANVISRVEVRYDKITDHLNRIAYASSDNKSAGLGIYANWFRAWANRSYPEGKGLLLRISTDERLWRSRKNGISQKRKSKRRVHHARYRRSTSATA
jgi:hypothetical protein